MFKDNSVCYIFNRTFKTKELTLVNKVLSMSVTIYWTL